MLSSYCIILFCSCHLPPLSCVLVASLHTFAPLLTLFTRFTPLPPAPPTYPSLLPHYLAPPTCPTHLFLPPAPPPAPPTALQKHYRTLEAIALDQEEAEEFVDYTLPDLEMMERRAGAAVDDFIRAVFPGGCPSEHSKPGAKRKVNGWVEWMSGWGR